MAVGSCALALVLIRAGAPSTATCDAKLTLPEGGPAVAHATGLSLVYGLHVPLLIFCQLRVGFPTFGKSVEGTCLLFRVVAALKCLCRTLTARVFD